MHKIAIALTFVLYTAVASAQTQPVTFYCVNHFDESGDNRVTNKDSGDMFFQVTAKDHAEADTKASELAKKQYPDRKLQEPQCEKSKEAFY